MHQDSFYEPFIELIPLCCGWVFKGNGNQLKSKIFLVIFFIYNEIISIS